MRGVARASVTIWLAVATVSACASTMNDPGVVAKDDRETPPDGPSARAAGAASNEDTASQVAPAPMPREQSVAPVASASDAPSTPAACPATMKLVEGDYCTKVEQKCLVHWWAPQNKKKVCEQFEPTTRCVGERIKKRYCIDTYAWPNQHGARPEVMNTFYQAQVKCAAAGKRMCSESEWNFACEGPEMKPFPYGFTRDPKKCNGDHRWDNPKMSLVAKRDPTELARLWRGVPSGSQPECVSDFGVHDLPANNDEVVAGETAHTKFSSVNTGGPWYSGVRNQCRPKVYTHAEGFYYYFLGFRCCANPDGEANEPRTPKQLARKWKFSRVERLARFTVSEMQEKLRQKEAGTCDCGKSKVLCKTMCGTLLGPGAKDGDDSTRVPHRARKKIK